jgi:hypothetical protein
MAGPIEAATESPTKSGNADNMEDHPMSQQGEVTLIKSGRQYGAKYIVDHGKLYVRTHTESRSLELCDRDPADLARAILEEIVGAQPNP